MSIFYYAIISTALTLCPVQDTDFSKFQKNPVKQEVEISEAKGTAGFRKTIIQASKKAFSDGEITRKQLLKIRLGTLSPAVLEKIEDVAIMQMAASGEDLSGIVEVNSDGKINRASIDWNNLIDFVERLIPIILQIIQIFA